MARSTDVGPGHVAPVVSLELLAKVAALSEGARVVLAGYIESTFDGGTLSTPEQHELVVRRDAELGANRPRPH